MRAFAQKISRGSSDLFARRVRGFRVIEVGGFACLIALVLGVYLFKGMAGAEGAQIADTNRQIAAEQVKVRALRAELAHLEAPERLERLSTQYLGLQPVSPRHETAPEALPAVQASGLVQPSATQPGISR